MTPYTRAEQPEDDGHSADGEHKGSYGAWRSMETAPKDGTEILACWPKRKLDDEDAPTGEIVSYAQCVTEWQGFWIEPDYLDAHGSYFLEDEAFADQPTHWMPLPPAPTGADTEGTGLMSPDGVSPAPAPLLASPASEQGEREAFEDFAAYVAANYYGDVVFADTRWHAERLWRAARGAAARASLRASSAVPVAQDERAEALQAAVEALQAAVEALESFPGFAADIGDERDTFVRKGKVALALGRAALSAATPPAGTQSDIERLVSDLSLLVNRMARRLSRRAGGEGTEAGDREMARQASEFLRRKNLTSPLRDDAAMGTPPADNKENGNG